MPWFWPSRNQDTGVVTRPKTRCAWEEIIEEAHCLSCGEAGHRVVTYGEHVYCFTCLLISSRMCLSLCNEKK